MFSYKSDITSTLQSYNYFCNLTPCPPYNIDNPKHIFRVKTCIWRIDLAECREMINFA